MTDESTLDDVIRPTGPQLEEWWRDARARKERAAPDQRKPDIQIILLVHEVKRLRNIIAGAADDATESSGWCRGCERTLIGRDHADDCSIDALEREAELHQDELRAAQGSRR